MERQLAEGAAASGSRSGSRSASPTCCACRRPSSPTTAFPALAFRPSATSRVHHGEGRWNGVAILSRVGIDDAAVGFAPDDEIVRRRGPPPVGDLRRRPRRHRVRAERPVGRPRAVPVQARVAGARCAPTSTPPVIPTRRRRRVRRLQHRSRRPRRLGPDRGARRHPRQRAGASRTRASCTTGVWSTCSGGTTTRRSVLVVGLPRRRLPQAPGMRIDLMLATKPLAKRSRWALIDRNARKGKPRPTTPPCSSTSTSTDSRDVPQGAETPERARRDPSRRDTVRERDRALRRHDGTPRGVPRRGRRPRGRRRSVSARTRRGTCSSGSPKPPTPGDGRGQ